MANKIVVLFLISLVILTGCDSPTSSNKNDPPGLPSSPSPADGATDVSVDPTFSWSCTDPDGDVVTFEFLVIDDLGNGFFGTTNNESIGLQSSLDYETRYRWQILATDGEADTVVGPIWEFTTEESPPVLFVSPGTMNFGTSTTPIAITVSNNGGGTLLWTATANQSWISLAPGSGSTTSSSPDLVTVTVNRSGLSAGSYSGTVTIEENAAGGQSMNVSVLMEVASGGLPNLTLYSGPGSDNLRMYDQSTHVLEVHISVWNNGPVAAGPYETSLYLSTNTTISPSDFLLGVFTDSDGQQPNTYSNLNTGPQDLDAAGLSAGTYYVGWIFDVNNDVLESDENDNIFYFTTPIVYPVPGSLVKGKKKPLFAQGPYSEYSASQFSGKAGGQVARSRVSGGLREE